MTYTGYAVQIPLGVGGLKTDDDQTSIPPIYAIAATNVNIQLNVAEKIGGSLRYNTAALPAEIVAVYDWHPTSNRQRMIAVTATGMVYRDDGNKTFTNSTAIATNLGNLDPNMYIVEAGLETAGQNKKLFFFTGTRQVQFLDGDATALTTIAKPAVDWSTQFPKFGIVHRQALWVFGNANNPHQAYRSNPTNHQDFQSTDAKFYSIFPGEGAGLAGGFVYKGKLFLMKQPYGVYGLVDTDADSANWYFTKLNDSFGLSAPHAAIPAMDDQLAGNSTGSVTSMAATNALGDVSSGDVLTIMNIENFVRENTTLPGVSFQHAMYYAHKKTAIFTYRSTVGQSNDRMIFIDFNKAQPRATFGDKDQASCMEKYRDDLGVQRPMYGARDGYVYIMDRADRDVGGVAYTGEVQTPHMDFTFADPKLADKNKLFDYLEVVFAPNGNWNLSVDYFVDGIYRDTITFTQVIGTNVYDTAIFDTDIFSTEAPQSVRKELKGEGKRISFRCYNSELDHSFAVNKLIVSFRVADERQEDA